MDHRFGFFHSYGEDLFEQSWRPSGRRPRAIVVLVHGLEDHSGRYAELASELVQAGYLVAAFDLRGHGRSSGVRADVATFDDHLRDLDVFLARVRGREATLPIFEMGHSMGGAIVTLHTLTRKPSDVRGIVLSAAALGVNVSGFTRGATRAVATLAPDAGIFHLDLGDFSRDAETVRASKADPLVFTGGAPARTAVALLDAIEAIREHAGELTVPVLAVHGEDDKITPPQGSRDLIRRAASRDKTLRILPHLYHDLLHEPERALVRSLVRDWIEARTP